jgi:hypothetical protein
MISLVGTLETLFLRTGLVAKKPAAPATTPHPQIPPQTFPRPELRPIQRTHTPIRSRYWLRIFGKERSWTPYIDLS